MADTTIELNAGTGGGKLKVDSEGTDSWPYSKMAFGPSGTQTHVESTVGLPVQVLSGTITADAGTNLNTSLLALEAGGNLATIAGAISGAEMQVDVLTVPAPLSVIGGGTEATALRVTIADDSTGNISVNDGGFALQIIGDVVQGGSVALTSPVFMGGIANTGDTGGGTTNQTATGIQTDINGRTVIEPFATNDNDQMGQTTHTSTTTNQELFAAAGVNIRNRLSDISISNTSATDTEVILKDGTTEIYRWPAPAGGGAIDHLQKPLFSTANAALNVATADSVASVRVSASGYKAR